MNWVRSYRADRRLAALADRHYSRQTVGAAQFAPPGRFVGLITASGDAGWVSIQTVFPDTEWMRDAWCCTLFRNESPILSSQLITEAVAATAAEWGEAPAGGFVTTVDARKVRRKRDPGRCFIKAGWHRLPEVTKDRGLLIFRLEPEDFPAAVEPIHTQLKMAA